jgi:putative oxidoreductase
MNHVDTAALFQTRGIPMPGLNAGLATSAECFGGLILLAGFTSRLTAIPLSITMIVAYLTADNEALKSVLSVTDLFTSATPVLFLLGAVLVVAFSVDRLLERRFSRTPMNAKG